MGTLISKVFSNFEPIHSVNLNESLRGDEQSRIYRQQAQSDAEKRNEYFMLSKEAFRRKNHEKAQKYSLLRRRHQRLMNEANKQANDAIFNYLNGPERPENEIDLHGLFVSEAIDRLKIRLDVIGKKDYERLYVIVGRGIHSPDGPKLKPAVFDFASKHNIPHVLHIHNSGCIVFDLRERLRLRQETKTSDWISKLFGWVCSFYSDGKKNC